MVKKVIDSEKSNAEEINSNGSITAVGYVWTSPNSPDAENIAKESKSKIAKYCQEQNIVLKKMFKDLGSTGSAIKRSEMQSLLKYMQRNKVDYLILDSLYSVGRRFHDAIVILAEFHHLGKGLISIYEDINTTTEEGKTIIKALLKIPQVSQWTQPTQEKKKVREHEIFYSGGACPYGYEIDSRSNQYKIIEDEAVVVRRIFRERMAGRSLRQISNDLIKDEISTKRGGKWQANTIKTILENPFYMGVYGFNDIVYKDSHDAIVSEYIFNKVNELSNAKNPVR
ncbi:MAG: recombinase family protein [Candidatus Sericytochromatia bacterium]